MGEIKENGETQGAYPISRDMMDKLLIKAYNITKTPLPYYPTVEMLDDLLESEQFQEDPWVREDSFKLFVLCVASGFSKDTVWHKENPGHKHITADNIYTYVTTPCTGEDASTCHSNVWENGASDEAKEDRQAAFEYMQSIITDTSIFRITDKKKRVRK